MGKAARWLKSLLGMKEKRKEKNQLENSNLVSDEKKEKNRWSFGGKSARETNGNSQIPTTIPLTESDWLRSYMIETEKEQNKHAIAVAAATAAAADAAVAAAQAAVAVVRLTSNGRGTLFGGGREKWAAVKLQAVFRGYLARKALRALRGLVKLQALVRGFLVRKRATATLHSMQALIRAQTSARSQRAHRSSNKENKFENRKSFRSDDTNEVHSKRLYGPIDLNAYDETPKIVEIDTYRTRSRSRRMMVDLPESDGKCDAELLKPQIQVPNYQSLHNFEWCFTRDECDFSTAQSTPRFPKSVYSFAPPTPSKSVCGDIYLRPYSNYCPNYMANTKSFKAKVRSHSAPKQRPELGPRKRISLNEILASRNSISSVRMQRSSCSSQPEEEDIPF